MTTTMLPEAPVPPPRATAMVGPLTIRADLLPAEVIAKRRLRALKRHLFVGLVVVLGLLVAWYGVSALRTANARSSLSSAQRTTAQLQQQVHSFGPLVNAQAQSSAIKHELSTLTAGDLAWGDVLNSLRHAAPSGVSLTKVSGAVSTAGSTTNSQGGITPGLSVLNTTGKTSIGQLTLSGTASSKAEVAAYMDALGKVHGLTAPYPANVSFLQNTWNFTANVIITSDLLGGRYTPATQGGH